MFGADTGAVFLQDVLTQDAVVIEDTAALVLAQGHVPADELLIDLEADAASDGAYVVLAAGDVQSPRTIGEAVLEGLRADVAIQRRGPGFPGAADRLCGNPPSPARDDGRGPGSDGTAPGSDCFRRRSDEVADMGDGALELRLVVTAEDYDEALRFYRDALGLPEIAAFDDGAGRVSILDAGRATLELSDVGHAEHIDRLEVGRRVAGHIRVAFGVTDAAAATDRLVRAGAALIAAPVETPWRSLNSRLEGPAGLQLTLFEALAPEA